jgi:two-component system OmpR family response regulator
MQLRLLVGLILLLLLIIPATAANNNPYEKIVVITLAYDNGMVKEGSSEIQYGTAPNLNLQSGSIGGLLLDAQKKTINEFSIRDPRIQMGDSAAIGSGGTAQGLVGSTQDNPHVDFGVIVPFTPDLQDVTLVDSPTGNTLITVDLTGPKSAFQQMYPDDPDLRSVQKPEPASAEPARTIPVTAEIVAILGVMLIAISGIGYFVRRPQPTQILIVDDEPAIVDVFSQLLSRKGYVPMTAQSGEECISVLKNQKKLPNLILLDIMMYPMDGWQTLEKIKENSLWKDIPVLMVTGKQPTPAEAKKYGLCIEDYILKPIKAHELYGAIEYVLMRKKVIAGEIRVALNAGFEKELVCEYARLRKRVEVEKKLIGIIRSAFTTGGSVADDMLRTFDDVSAEIGSREMRLRKLQSQLAPVLSSEPVPVECHH